MHGITTIVTFATILLLQSTGRAQQRPILNPSELIGFDPRPTEFQCVEHWDIPEPVVPINWREFPPEGLIEIRPEPGFPLPDGSIVGQQQFTYDEDGRLATWMSTRGNFQNVSDYRGRTAYSYDDLGHLAEVVREIWRDERWFNDSYASYSYTDTGLVARRELSLWDGTDWVVRETVACRYDDSGRLTRRLGENCPAPTFPVPNPVCEPSDSTIFVYDDLGRISEADRSTSVFRQGWRRSRTRFEYDEAGRVIEAVNPANDPFRAGERFEYNYDATGRISHQEIFRDLTKRRVRYSYQHDGRLTRTADDAWRVGPDGYIEQGETRFEYDGRGMLETVLRYPGDPEFWSRSRYRHENGRIIQETRSAWIGSAWDEFLVASYEYGASGLLESYSEVWDAEQRQGEFRLVFSYAVGTASSPDLPTTRSIQLHPNYPNPVQTRTTIAYTLDRATDVRLSVFDALGRTVRSLDARPHAPGTHMIELDASNLPPGVYLYRLEADGTVQSGNMVVAD